MGRFSLTGFVRPRNIQTGTTYTPTLDDSDSFITLNNASAITVTIPTAATAGWLSDTILQGCQYGAGQVTLVGAAGVTLRNAGGLKTNGQYAVWEARYLGSDEWLVYGRMIP